MGLHLRNRIWHADYVVDGRRVQESTGTANKREAKLFLESRISQIHQGTFVRKTSVTLQELWELYFPHARLHKHSWKRDEQLYAQLKAFLGTPLLRDITVAKLEQYQQVRSQDVAPATVNREMALLKHLFFQAQIWGMHTNNPVCLVRFLREENLKCEILTVEEERKLLDACPGYLKDIVSFALNTGLRRSDVFNLKWEDVIIDDNPRLSILMRKTHTPHVVFLNSAALAVLQRQRKDTEHVFANPMTGEKLTCVRGALAAAVKRAGIKKTTFHTFRHTTATRLLQNGEDFMTVKEIMGHRSLKTTERYVRSNNERQRNAMQKLSRDTSVTVTPSA